MKLLWLKEIIGDAYTEDMDAAACQAIGKDFVASADFNAKNTRVKELEAQVGQLEEAAKGHAKQLDELKKSAGDNEELTRKIGELEQQNKADKAAYEKELATIRLTAAVDAELTAAGAKNNTAVRALLDDYLKDAKIEDGKVVAKVNNESITLAAKIEAMKKDANTDFLFGSTGAKLTGLGNPATPTLGGNPARGKSPLRCPIPSWRLSWPKTRTPSWNEVTTCETSQPLPKPCLLRTP